MDTFRLSHVALSLVGIITGLVILAGLIRSQRTNG